MDIGIDEFGSEGENGFSVNGAVRVDEVLARSTPIDWDEAVALLQEVLDALTSANRDDVPGFDDVFIDADGVVTIHGGRRGERGPVAAGRALHSLLATADVPVALRLFVTQATAPDTHESLRAFSDGLAYFGKSGRSDMVRAVYDRYRAAAGAAPAPARPRTLSATPAVLPAVQKAEFTPPVRPRRRRLPRWAFPAAVAAVAVAALSVVWLTMGSSLGILPGSAEAAADVPAEVPAPNTTSTKTASSTQARSQSPATATSSSADALTAPSTRRDLAANASTSREGTETNNPRIPQVISFETLRAPTAFDSSAPRPAAAADASERTLDGDPSKIIYSRADADVQPPMMLYPQMPPPLVIGTPPGIVNSMELVIGLDGSVERVRLVSTPRRMADMMLLSGAKLWRFSPAVRNGEPVRYRTTMSWTVFP